MDSNILTLAMQGIRRKKKSSILIFIVLLLSFAFAIASVSLVSSISKTNAEFRLNTFGEWYYAIPAGTQEDAVRLENQAWAETVGVSHSYGIVWTETGSVGFGTIDDAFKEVGRLKLDAGRWPEADNEIVLEADTLGILGYDYTIGQEIEIPIQIFCGETPIVNRYTFTLCGIVSEYTDLWVLNYNSNGYLLNGAIVTKEGAENVREQAGSMLLQESIDAGVELDAPIPQYFISVAVENRETAYGSLESLLSTNPLNDPFPCVNTLAYPNMVNKDYDSFYAYLIAVVAMLAVLCIYIIQLPAEIKSFTILRSIGITKGQMGLLLVTESLLLAIPALLCGIPLSVGITWFAMKTIVYAGSVAIQVVIHWSAIGTIVVIWIVVIIISRLLVYLITLRTPLTGRMQIQNTKARRVKLFRSTTILLLLVAFGFVTVFTAMEPLPYNDNKKHWASYPAYTLWTSGTISETDAELIEQIPGIYRVEGFGELKVHLSYDGLEERKVYLYALDDSQWGNTFDYGDEQESFRNGDTLLILFPDETIPTETYVDETDENFILPESDVVLRLYSNDGKCIMESKSTHASVRWISNYTEIKMLTGLHMPYTVICSETYLKTLLDSMPSEITWGKYTTGEPFGYGRVYAYVEQTAEDLSTDTAIAEFCNKQDIHLDNRRQEFTANMQTYAQQSLFLYGSGICIGLMILLILTSTLSLEAESEKRYFIIMNRLGMSPWQRRLRICGKALGRSILTSVLGFMLYLVYTVILRLQEGFPLSDAVLNLNDWVKQYDYDFRYILMVSAICIFIPLLISIISKRNLNKEGYDL